jgi:hypothetical protein
MLFFTYTVVGEMGYTWESELGFSFLLQVFFFFIMELYPPYKKGWLNNIPYKS